MKNHTLIFFLVMSILGTTTLQIQDAYAVASAYDSSITGAVGGNSASTTNLVVTFDQAVYVDTASATGTNVDKQTLFSLSGGAGGAGITSANIVDEANEDCAGGGTTNVTIVLDTALETDATPTIAFTNDTTVLSCENDGLAQVGPTATNFAAQTPSDGLSPTMDSASKTSATSINVTFSEDMDATSIVTTDFTVAGSTVSAVSENNGVVTLTLGNALGEDVTPLITLAGGVDDASANTNTLAAGPTVTATDDTANVVSQNGAGCSGDCEAPTLGINSRGDRFVTNGFTYNGYPIDVERFFTPYPLIDVEVGKQNKAIFKIYDDYGVENIKHIAFGFGLGKDQVISNSKAVIELDIAFDGTETVTVYDPENALDNVNVRTSIGDCNGEPGIECLIVTVDHMFRDPLEFNIVGTNVWDTSLNGWQNYYNHGIKVVGESLNPPKEFTGIYKGKIFHLIEVEKNITIDENGDFWTFSNGQWVKDYVKPEQTEDTAVNVLTRNHSSFNYLKQQQVELAEEQMQKICPTCSLSFDDFESSFTHYFPSKINKLDDPVIQKMLESENLRAQKYVETLFEYLYDHNHGKEIPN